MHVRGARSTKASMGVAAAVVLLPVVATTSVQTVEAAHVDRADRPVRASTVAMSGVLYRMASRSAVRAAVTDALALEAAPAEAAVHLRKGEVAVSSPKGTHVWTISALSDHGLPVAAERAYKHAAALMAQSDPSCRLPWTLLAGIGRVESDHGRYGGARLDTDGVSRPKIIGVALDGAGPVAAIHDTDNGKYDGDKVWDRAVGPMQFIPSTWAYAARDGDGDGQMSPFDLDDAAAATAAYLCAGSGDLSDPVAQKAAIYRYNQDDYYVALVQAFEEGYRTGTFVIPPMPVEEQQARTPHKRHHRAKGGAAHGPARDRRKRHHAAGATRPPTSTVVTVSRPQPKPAPAPSPNPAPAPAPKPSPAPAPSPAPTDFTGDVTGSAGSFFLGDKLLDLGVLSDGAAPAAHDFDGNGVTETNGAELQGLVGKTVTMLLLKKDDGTYGIYNINGLPLS